VRLQSRRRKLTCVLHSALYVAPPLLSWKFTPFPCSGMVCRKSPSVSFPLSCHCWRVSTATGAGVVRSLRRTRDPVTTICSSIGLVPLGAVVTPLGGGSFGRASAG